MSRVNELTGQLRAILEELLEIEENSNRIWKEHTEILNVLDHETEIIPLNGGQLLKVASFRRKIRLERRHHKHNWYCSKAFNESFQTKRVLNSMDNAFRNLRKQERAGQNLIENRGLIESILSTEPEELGVPLDIRELQANAQQIAAAFDDFESDGKKVSKP